jgi:CopG antitoxin of type II toxin-antitoxin system
MTEKQNSTPTFSSREEEAAFWDTHDTTDFEHEFTDVKVRFAKNLSQPLSIRLDPKTLEELRQQAHEKGIGPTTLARMWILERLRSEQRP